MRDGMPMNANSIDIRRTPFSRYGAWLSVTYDSSEGCLTIHNVRRKWGEDKAYRVRFLKEGSSVSFEASASPALIMISSRGGCVRAYIKTDTSLVFDSDGLDLMIEQIDKSGYGIEYGERQIRLIGVAQRINTTIRILRGSALLEGPLTPAPGGSDRNRKTTLKVACHDGRALVHMDISNRDHRNLDDSIDPQRDIGLVDAEWGAFFSNAPPAPTGRSPYTQLAWYVLWSCFVRAEYPLRYDAILMSKSFMCSLWSWDHCFNALALSLIDARRAIEQFLLPFELQAESGVLPDAFAPNAEIVWGVTKPPVHGWCFGKLMERIELEKDLLRSVYRHLEKWTAWWLEYRDSDRDGVSEYPQGCDSGCDNSTLFDGAFFVESPDLPSYLFLQMKTLARIAKELGIDERSEYWDRRATALLRTLLDHSWRDGRFIAPVTLTHEFDPHPTSLLPLLPIVLGSHLDLDRFDTLVGILESDFLTEYGPATEATRSRFYEDDGYWRGPIWAPHTYLLVDGLKRGGRHDIAKEIARRFCAMIETRALGFYENFDAKTGSGYRALGYSWTASVYLLLAHEYLS